MDLKTRTKALAKLGETLGNLSVSWRRGEKREELETVLRRASSENGWFTPENILFSFQKWAEALTRENLDEWISKYNDNDFSQEPGKIKTVAIVMAGNIPLVGLHDFLAVLITGNKVLAKLSSKDKILLPFLSEKLIGIEPDFNRYIEFTEGKLENFDAVIATGSDNTSRYFDYYFGKYPHIIRRNRNSVAILTGKEKQEELEGLADDIFRYFGLGCRNVSKLYVPEGYDFKNFFEAVYRWKEIIHNHKYINNYDYNKAVYLMDSLPLLDNEFVLLKEDSGFSTPIGVVFYEKYTSLEDVKTSLEKRSDHIQCIVSQGESFWGIPFGETQQPRLWDYADGVDTLEFLLGLD